MNNSIRKIDISKNIDKLETNWKDILYNKDTLRFIENINENLNNEIDKFEGLAKIFPEERNIFNAFNHFNIGLTKVCIIGQDCYHQENQAHGLCFSVKEGIKIPPSLKNIFKELRSDVGFKIPENGNLTQWAEQGILMLNASLTVRESCANSHSKYWEPYTDYIIKMLSDSTENIIFILWVNYAKKKKKLIDIDKHYILEANHPSPLSANRPGWFGCKHFSKCNEILKDLNKEIIDWQII